MNASQPTKPPIVLTIQWLGELSIFSPRNRSASKMEKNKTVSKLHLGDSSFIVHFCFPFQILRAVNTFIKIRKAFQRQDSFSLSVNSFSWMLLQLKQNFLHLVSTGWLSVHNCFSQKERGGSLSPLQLTKICHRKVLPFYSVKCVQRSSQLSKLQSCTCFRSKAKGKITPACRRNGPKWAAQGTRVGHPDAPPLRHSRSWKGKLWPRSIPHSVHTQTDQAVAVLGLHKWHQNTSGARSF